MSNVAVLCSCLECFTFLALGLFHVSVGVLGVFRVCWAGVIVSRDCPSSNRSSVLEAGNLPLFLEETQSYTLSPALVGISCCASLPPHTANLRVVVISVCFRLVVTFYVCPVSTFGSFSAPFAYIINRKEAF